MEETAFSNYTCMDTSMKEAGEYTEIQCGHLNPGKEWKDNRDNRYFKKSTVCKFVSAIVAAIVFAGCGNFVYLFITGTRDVKLVIPDGYLLEPKEDVRHKSRSSEMTTSKISPSQERKDKVLSNQLSTTKGIPTLAEELTSSRASTTVTPDCKDDWWKFGRSCYYFSNDRKTWQAAFNTCLETDGYLVEITSAAEDQSLAEKAKETSASYWIGISDIDEEDTWIWMKSKTSANYTNWAPGEPSNSVRGNVYEHCGLLSRNYQWNDGHCHTLLKYVCEQK